MRWVRAGFLPLSITTLVSAAMIVPLPFYVERPGRTVSLDACVTVAPEEAAAPAQVAGDFLLTTINVLAATTVDAVLGIADDEVKVVPRGALLPPGVESDTFFDQQRALFASTADVAAAVGLEAAGYEVAMEGDGVEVVRILPGTPAEGALRPGDVITGIDGTPVQVESELREIIAAAEVGQTLSLDVRRGDETLVVEVAPTLIQDLPVVGILPTTLHPRVTLPVPVDVTTGEIGGPSAGLMIALTVYDKVLPDVDLAAGRVIAGTGSIDQDGRIGPIGGIELKVLAADAQGADVFLAPVANHRRAAAAMPAGSSLRVVPVETFEQALAALAETAGEVSRGAVTDQAPCPYREPA